MPDFEPSAPCGQQSRTFIGTANLAIIGVSAALFDTAHWIAAHIAEATSHAESQAHAWIQLQRCPGKCFLKKSSTVSKVIESSGVVVLDQSVVDAIEAGKSVVYTGDFHGHATVAVKATVHCQKGPLPQPVIRFASLIPELRPPVRTRARKRGK